ncbi:hypothetical protein SMC26_10495 [Actinomadura fulvescens]|uniref:Uncharacterized protein n=1 Tax=Actinomadura fulvescens TaxID=46160 RepID=A0ABP6CDY1_9ACTN
MRQDPRVILDALFDGWAKSVGVPATAQQITGRPARTFAQWATDHAADFA